VAHLSPNQLAWRGRIEAGIRLAAPFLDLLLAAGDRVSRVVDRDEPELLLSGRLTRDDSRRTLGDGRD
jgi:hypothetical protein